FLWALRSEFKLVNVHVYVLMYKYYSKLKYIYIYNKIILNIKIIFFFTKILSCYIFFWDKKRYYRLI
ncbi:hypothetical protein K6L59_03580, partial [Candidatus Phytoplasma sp. Tabriz.2]|nr:hypothetical protein [Candidatus Phytoplasma australiense]